MNRPQCEQRRISGWGLYPAADCCVYRPDRREELSVILATRRHRTLIARGAGRSYGDAALGDGGAVISHLRLDRLLSFDPDSGILECEAGTLLGDIIDVFLPRGFFPPVMPGTRHVTIGGAIANDVHGKNHRHAGSFGRHVLELTLLTADGRTVVCSPSVNAETFRATLGGLGLTGLILTARVRLRRVQSAAMTVDVRRCTGLPAALAELDAMAQRCEHTIAWLDGAMTSAAQPALVFGADHAAHGTLPAAGVGNYDARMSVPFVLPYSVFSTPAMTAFNRAYHARHPERRGAVTTIDRFLFPLDAVGNWNRLHGRRGFVQYQVAVDAAAASGLFADLLERSRTAGQMPFLVVVKAFGAGTDGHLSFPHPGFTLAFDLPLRNGVPALVRELDASALAHGARVYLGKDALLTPATFRGMYANVERFGAEKRRLDPNGVFASALSRRLELTG